MLQSVIKWAYFPHIFAHICPYIDYYPVDFCAYFWAYLASFIFQISTSLVMSHKKARGYPVVGSLEKINPSTLSPSTLSYLMTFVVARGFRVRGFRVRGFRGQGFPTNSPGGRVVVVARGLRHHLSAGHHLVPGHPVALEEFPEPGSLEEVKLSTTNFEPRAL